MVASVDKLWEQDRHPKSLQTVPCNRQMNHKPKSNFTNVSTFAHKRTPENKKLFIVHTSHLTWVFSSSLLCVADATPLFAVVSLWDCYRLCHVVIAVHEHFFRIRVLSLFIYQTSYLALLLSDVVTLCLSLVGQSAVTHQPSPRTHSSERCVFHLWTELQLTLCLLPITAVLCFL